MDLVSLKTDLRQELKLTPQLLQSIEILQMNSQELLDYLNHVSEENPLLEQEESSDLRTAYDELRQKVSWLDGGEIGNTFLHTNASLPERGVTDYETDSLSAFLCDQLERLHLSKPLLSLTTYLAKLVNEDGWLEEDDLDELRTLKIPSDLIDQALITIQSLEPAGVGARTLSECLLLQLDRLEDTSRPLKELVSRFLPDLSRKHYALISRELGISVEEILELEKRISQLNPRPGQAYQPVETSVYIRPDVYIVELEGELQVLLNEYYLPRISISSYYVQLLQSELDKETRDYLHQKLQQAKWVLSSIERRDRTLHRCADAILTTQYNFFTGHTSSLTPMTLESLARTLSLHPSTISRATRGKYLQCRQGTYPLRHFFSRSMGDDAQSAQAVRQRLLELIQNEDPHNPLSDQKLCDLLCSEGIQIARRTVAKYRIALNIAAVNIRKIHN